MSQYLISFSSYYQVAYAQERLHRAGIHCQIGKTPPSLMRSCGYALYMTTQDIHYILHILDEGSLSYRTVYRMERENGSYSYYPVAYR